MSLSAHHARNTAGRSALGLGHVCRAGTSGRRCEDYALVASVGPNSGGLRCRLATWMLAFVLGFDALILIGRIYYRRRAR